MIGEMMNLPDDYPTFEQPETAFNPNGTNLIVEIGDYVVNRDGHICIATTSNAGPYPNDFLRSINESCFRARYLGESGDYLELANQSRKATKAEITKARKFEASITFVSDWKGQIQLL